MVIKKFSPFICNEESFVGTSNLPSLKRTCLKSKGRNFLIPTAEVPLTNIFSGDIIDESICNNVVAYSACFRSEAGSYGKDVKGLIRQHQFNKVELIQNFRSDWF